MMMRDLWLVMKRVLRNARQAINAGLEPLGLTGAEGDILFHLLSRQDGLTQEQLAQRLNIGKAAVSRTVNAMVAKGYAHRQRHPLDARAFNVSLSEKALAISAQAAAVYEGVFSVIRQGIPDEDLNKVASILEQADRNLLMPGIFG